MKSTSGTSKVLAIAGGCVLVGVMAVLGCSDQYADVGTVDVSASKAKARDLGLDEFKAKQAKARSSARGPAIKTEKTVEPPGRGALPKS